jgi:predicted dehydrogenase
MNPQAFSPPPMSRRGFLLASTAATLSAASWARAAGSNSRVGVAMVGCGIRGHEVMSHILATGRAELRCLCDIYDEHRAKARESLVPGQSPFETVAIEEAIAHPGVDAVLLAVPDHLHVTLGTMVLKANKHLYLEKPIAHRSEEHAALIEAVKGRNVVLQCGMQQRSGTHYQEAKAEIVDKGKLGQVLFVRGVWHDFPRQRRPFKSVPKPAGLDWERFLGPAPKRPFEWMRYDSWRLFPDYGGGQLSDILTHWVDVAQWFLNDPRPLDAVATGGIYRLNDGRENPDTVSAILRYPKHWNFNFECTLLPIPGVKPHVAFYGTEGTLEISRTNYSFRAARKHAVEVKATGNLDGAHATNWLDAIAGAAPVNGNLAAGLSACDAVHLARAAYWSGKRLRYDESGKITTT